jgi:hypothetical protein
MYDHSLTREILLQMYGACHNLPANHVVTADVPILQHRVARNRDLCLGKRWLEPRHGLV